MAPSLILLVTYQTTSVPILVLLSKSAQSISLSALLYAVILYSIVMESISEYDCPAFGGMFDTVCEIAGSSLAAAQCLADGDCKVCALNLCNNVLLLFIANTLV